MSPPPLLAILSLIPIYLRKRGKKSDLYPFIKC